ncbi:adenosylmethionine-8-amino-7-oxononanoate aminotransferase [Paenibacillus cellulosilyticus]|uniref:Adenosylmethionine-8-amino-7-oxononanoate aminotransferase n=1 Tax=Paenibacillus cellulosilyticus TaxID=375489 RepID=A0A2V2Z2I5_9BACL|nr:aspartate aminotransferase family protein [Paenibacillus cellulosilyticus]PWW02861.1 adenosylmethionine-8-amino-7-oxononanoate aminotransferase [Paenibacillus cellulosilyticus]QKS45777.1 aspartate aminotransferase family protein [Paenibacillus cellulosilyticus]
MTKSQLSYEMNEMKDWDLQHLWHPYTQMGTYADEQMMVTSANGCYVTDAEGNPYMDGISGLWNVNAGHGRQEIIDSIYEQLKALDFFPLNGYTYPSAAVLSKKLIDLAPDNLNRVFYCNGGSEANETAIKMVRAYWKLKGQAEKYKIVSLNSAWHGGTLGALSASHIASEKRYFEPMPAGFIHMMRPDCYRKPEYMTEEEYGLYCANLLEEIIEHEDGDTIAAFLAEPIQGVGGVKIPPANYWPRIREICDKHNILLIIDEVATGFGRTGTPFAITQWGVQPDLLVCAKGISSGYLPLSAVLTTEEIHLPFTQEGKYFQHGYTTGGHPAACAAAVANIDLMEREGLLTQSEEKRNYMLNAFKSLLDLDLVGDVRGRGFMVCVELVNDKTTKEPYAHAKALCRELRNAGIIVRPIGNSIPFFPPLIITEEQIDDAVSKYRRVLSEARIPAGATV